MTCHAEPRKGVRNAVVFTALILVLGSVSARSQDSKQADGNEYFASSMLIEDYQNCQGPGKIAISTKATMKDIEFVLSGTPTDRNVIVRSDSEVGPAPDVCYKTERRGTELVQFEVPCRKSPFETSFTRWTRKEKLSGQFTVDATLCISANSLELMGADWRLDITRGDDSVSITGDLQHPQFTMDFQLFGGVSTDPKKEVLWSISRADEGLSGNVGLACIPTGFTFRGDQQISATTIAKMQFVDRNSLVCENDDASCFGRVGFRDRYKIWRFRTMRNNMLYPKCPMDSSVEASQ